MSRKERDPWLLTPGPLTTSQKTKRAMLRDWGSRDGIFIELTRRVRDRLAALAGARETHVVVPLQGSGTYAVEAMLGTLVPHSGKVLILVNGAYGRRMARICEVLGRRHEVVEMAEDAALDPAAAEAKLAADPSFTHIAAVHCETGAGLLNPIEAIADVARRHGRGLLLDAMSTFGALPLEAFRVPFEAVAASANKCLEGVPGLSFVLVRRAALGKATGNAPSLSLDLHDQWRTMEETGQWRFTPPTHVVAALGQALEEHSAEGGVEGRGARYRENHRVLVEGMRALGFVTFLPDSLRAPVIVAFRTPADPKFVFEDFYGRLRDRGYVIYPGKLTSASSFRIGCIGRVGADAMRGVVEAIRVVLAEMGVTDTSPAGWHQAAAKGM